MSAASICSILNPFKPMSLNAVFGIFIVANVGVLALGAANAWRKQRQAQQQGRRISPGRPW